MKIKEKIRSFIKKNESTSASAAYNTRIKPGINSYNRLLSKYKECELFLCPYAGTGDVYLASMYINSFAKINGYEKFVVLVIGEANYKVAKLFGFENIEKISQNEADCLVRLSIFLGNDNDKIIIMHHRPPQAY